MAGPEPYPQVKWTREQEQAYAESRKPAKGSLKKAQPSRSTTATKTSGKKRVVRTQAGATRYKVPIGSEIGTARNAQGAQAQKDTESTGRYRALVGGDARAQAQAMQALNDDQVQRLARVAYSFRSSNPDVVRLRLGVAAELKRRGMNVNDFGGLGGGGTTPRRSAAKPAVPKARPKGKATPQKYAERTQAAMAAMYGRKTRELSVPQLRQALRAFGRIAPEKREVVARFLVSRAVELSAVHMVGNAVFAAANLTEERKAEVIELAGRWKHGYIPLDAVALRSKMKGGNGKPWWEGGKQHRRGGKGALSKSIAAGRAAREGRTVPRNKPSSKKDVAKVIGAAKPAAVESGGGPRKGPLTNKDTGNRFAAKTRVPKERTAVVKSSPKPERGSNMNKPTLAAHHGTLGKKVAGAPEGTQAFSVTGTSLHDTALFGDDGRVLGFAKKREGFSTVGRSGQATLAKKSGYNMYDARGNLMGSETTRTRALALMKKRSDAKQDKGNSGKA